MPHDQFIRSVNDFYMIMHWESWLATRFRGHPSTREASNPLCL